MNYRRMEKIQNESKVETSPTFSADNAERRRDVTYLGPSPYSPVHFLEVEGVTDSEGTQKGQKNMEVRRTISDHRKAKASP